MAGELLRFATAGSVDDGKSTLIGRLLYDSKSLFSDQLAAVEQVSRDRGNDYTDLALLTDGLRAEREQGITIDVAYRYFATPRRKFIIADTPGHIQYTRNMVTGASTADVALILLDARKGITEQSRRHAFLATLLGRAAPDRVRQQDGPGRLLRGPVRRDPARVRGVRDPPARARHDLRADLRAAGRQRRRAVRAHALVRGRDPAQPPRAPARRERPQLRRRPVPVQYVVRPQSKEVLDYRGYAGTVASGVLKAGDLVRALPSGLETTISSIETADGPVDEAYPPMSVTFGLTDDIDLSRGDMLCRPHNSPQVAQDIDAQVCWMDESAPLTVGRKYHIKHTTRWARVLVKAIDYRIDVNTLHRDEDATELSLNEIGRIQMRATQPLFIDPYQQNRATGAFILVDEASNKTVAAGMIGRLPG